MANKTETLYCAALDFPILIFAVALIFLSSCAPVYKARLDMTASERIIWPRSPEKPRIKYLWSLYNIGAEETEGEKTFLDLISGKNAEDIAETSGILLRPQGIYVDEKRFYIADPGASRVTVVDRSTMDVMHILDSKDEGLEYPLSVVADREGRIYISDPEIKKVIAYSGDGKFLFYFEEDIKRPTGLAIDRQRGLIYVVDSLGHTVHIYGLDGKRRGGIGRRGEGDGEFNFPSHAFVDDKGMLYVTDFLNFRIQVFSPDRTFVGKFGKLGDSFNAFDKPKGVAVDKEGDIYVVDAGKDMVKIFDKEGRLLLFFGDKGQRYGEFYLPTGIFIDDRDVIYVADTINMRIQAFQFLGGQ